MTIWRLTTLFITLLAAVCLSVSADAASTGKMTGQVINAETGEPIIGASVMVVGTKRGAVTDFDGKYIINQIEPGTYTIKITHLEYATVMLLDVEVTLSEVSDGVVSNDNSVDTVFAQPDSQMKRKSEQARKRPLIDCTDPPGIDKRAIQTQPVTTIDDLLKQVSGIVTNEKGEVFIRGGKAIKGASVPNEGEIPHVLAGVGVCERKAPIGHIEGLITDASTGGPVKAATVTIVGTRHAAVTDSDGRFVMEEVPIGKYEVIISGKDYNTTKVKDVWVDISDVTLFSYSLDRAK